MKLKIQNWKSAWFDSHINDRFFQEMSRVEKNMVNELETSAHWMEQVMIDVGQLAQAMIRLESSETPEPQVRHAMEKALRLSALSLQLVITLDGMDRDLLKSGQRQFALQDFSASPMAFVADYRAPAEAVEPPPAKPKSLPRDTAPAPLPPFLSRQTVLPEYTGAPRTNGKAPQTGPAAVEEPDPHPDQPAVENENQDSPFLSPFLALANLGGASEAGRSRMHDTIVSLNDKGLSRAEIEAVTGEPRNVIEAVIDHHLKSRSTG